MGDSLYVNPMVLGYAWQKGWIPLLQASLMRAIELNAVQVDANKAAFAWGRWAAADPQRIRSLLEPVQTVQWHRRQTLDELVAHRAALLTQYQNARWASEYTDFIGRVRQTEAALPGGRGGRTALAETVARELYRFMSYKDEYEVARLQADPAFLARIADEFEGDFRLHYHLAPPLWTRHDAQGKPIKQKYGPVMLTAFRLLARLKGLRGTALDPFGRTAERRTERALIGEYRALVDELLAGLTESNHAEAIAIAREAERIRGFGPVKERNLAAVRQQWANRLGVWRGLAKG